MNRFEKAIRILDNAVGGPAAPVSFHGAFWRGVTRNEFVMKKIFGLSLVTVGNGADSNLVKALKGELPFGADVPGRPEADFNRMPSGRDPVSDVDIAFLEKWIDDGCLEDEVVSVAPLTWRKTNAPVASSRTDDIWFIDPLTGWAVNSDGSIVKTTDGGDSWKVQLSAPGAYLRCVGFANANVGWVGTLSLNRRLFHTTDGGATWTRVSPLPSLAPVAICGISVVSDQIVFASGTNRPTDFPRMMKTTDGGRNWTAWDMSAHASILIDTWFKDALHGWVVGGKADEPTPTSRDKLKPVVLETTDGGATWTNRLAGLEAAFPFGEWGWKIQFLSDQVGFVSLENFSEAAILKTSDGGLTWTRLIINDAQGNVNLEGVGFIDEQQGWVGGWGPGGFGSPGQPQGLSSATTDGGQNWTDANEIGLFINRFRFFGSPVTVGYASGDTVYKYSADPIPPSPSHLIDSVDPRRALLPEARFESSAELVPVKINVPVGSKRLTLQVWDRFGIDLGCVLDETRPQAGERVFHWDPIDSTGAPLNAGEYILRLTVDDQSASSILLRRVPQANRNAGALRSVKSRLPFGIGGQLRRLTLADQMQNFAPEQRDLNWLRNSLQVAIQLELATLPPYLTAYWSIKESTHPARVSIREVSREEMLHFGLACNLLVAVEGSPVVANETVVPKYPGPLPGGIRPTLKEVVLRKLTTDQAKVFMDIEYPQGGPVAFAAAESFPTIGEFYEAVLATFKNLNPPLKLERQLSGTLGLFQVETLDHVEQAIRLVNLQGEGSNLSPEEKPGDLAHYYRFGEIHHERRFVKDPATNTWGYTGDALPLPATWDMADIPDGGYQRADVPDVEVWNLISMFDQQYSEMLRLLELAWQHGDDSLLGDAVGQMFGMKRTANQLIQRSRPDGAGNYGPCFRYVN